MHALIKWGILGLGKIAHKFAYDLILVDGPLGTIGRSGFYRNLALFRPDVPIILDDVDRKDELKLLKDDKKD